MTNPADLQNPPNNGPYPVTKAGNVYSVTVEGEAQAEGNKSVYISYDKGNAATISINAATGTDFYKLEPDTAHPGVNKVTYVHESLDKKTTIKSAQDQTANSATENVFTYLDQAMTTDMKLSSAELQKILVVAEQLRVAVQNTEIDKTEAAGIEAGLVAVTVHSALVDHGTPQRILNHNPSVSSQNEYGTKVTHYNGSSWADFPTHLDGKKGMLHVDNNTNYVFITATLEDKNSPERSAHFYTVNHERPGGSMDNEIFYWIGNKAIMPHSVAITSLVKNLTDEAFADDKFTLREASQLFNIMVATQEATKDGDLTPKEEQDIISPPATPAQTIPKNTARGK